MEFLAFGDAAGNFGNVIEIDNIYEISAGRITNDEKRGKLKAMLN